MSNKKTKDWKSREFKFTNDVSLFVQYVNRRPILCFKIGERITVLSVNCRKLQSLAKFISNAEGKIWYMMMD